MFKKNCSFCKNKLTTTFLDLGKTPWANSFLEGKNIKLPSYNLNTKVCNKCLLVQVNYCINPRKIFLNYAYKSGYSKTWHDHCKKYTKKIKKKIKLKKKSPIVEIASNDGTLLKQFKNKGYKNILGIEPAKNLAFEANKQKIKTLSCFLNKKNISLILKNTKKPKLIVANNVIAHIPDINDFCISLFKILHDDGVITVEFHHLLKLIKYNAFDTIYHEHQFYHSAFTLKKIFEKHNLKVFDADEINIHGGSLRLYICKKNNKNFKVSKKLNNLIFKEKKYGINKISSYKKFKKKITDITQGFSLKLFDIKRKNKKIFAYGAAAKGNTFINYLKLDNNIISGIYDKSPIKQGKYTPGSLIKVFDPKKIKLHKPDYLIILPWNIKKEVIKEFNYLRKWNGKFITFFPKMKIF